MKRNNKKGFTLAELLIVVAIIAVLVAIAIPVFTTQLDKSKLATATANARGVYAEYVADCLAADTPDTPKIDDLLSLVNGMDTNQKQGCTFDKSGDDTLVIKNSAGTLSNTIKIGI